MTALQYLMLGVSIFVLASTPFLLAKAIRRKQKYRIFEVPVAASMVLYLAIDLGWPSAIVSAPPTVHRLLPVLFLLWIADYFGIFRWLLNRQKKALPVERR